MDDPIVFVDYLTNVCNVNAPTARNEIIRFIPDFRALLNTPELQIDEFVKNTHRSNSAQASNGRILILSREVVLLK